MMEDKELKKLLSTTKLKADDDLKERIVHQIKAEKALIRKKEKLNSLNKGSYFSVFGIMYAILLGLGVYFYDMTEGNLFESSTFLFTAIFISSSFSIYYLINVYADYRRLKG